MDPDDFVPTKGQPIRRVLHLFLGRDRKTGERKSRVSRAEAHSLSDDGSPDSVHYTVPQVYDCGDSIEKPFGGQCFHEGCGALSCAECHGVCCCCRKPLCTEHSRYREVEGQGCLRFCDRCLQSRTCKRVLLGIGAFLAAPFVERADGGGSRR